MRSIERRFEQVKKENPYWSTYVSFAVAIKNQSFDHELIRVWFNKLVDKDDYIKNEKSEIIDYLCYYTNSLRRPLYGED